MISLREKFWDIIASKCDEKRRLTLDSLRRNSSVSLWLRLWRKLKWKGIFNEYEKWSSCGIKEQLRFNLLFLTQDGSLNKVFIITRISSFNLVVKVLLKLFERRIFNVLKWNVNLYLRVVKTSKGILVQTLLHSFLKKKDL